MRRDASGQVIGNADVQSSMHSVCKNIDVEHGVALSWVNGSLPLKVAGAEYGRLLGVIGWTGRRIVRSPSANKFGAKLIPALGIGRILTLVLVPEGRGARDRLVICGMGIAMPEQSARDLAEVRQPFGGGNEPVLRGL